MNGRAIIAKRLKALRHRAKLSQTKLGSAAGMEQFSASVRITNYEGAKTTPDYATLEALGKVLGVPAAYFIVRDDDLAELVEIFAALSEKGRRKALAALRALKRKDAP